MIAPGGRGVEAGDASWVAGGDVERMVTASRLGVCPDLAKKSGGIREQV
jgi:hypothetical protein